ncbi:MAG: glycoside hydrolase family 78 protein [Planctomycetota bacterium]
MARWIGAFLVMLMAACQATEKKDGDLRATHLACESRVEPLGIDEPYPRFSWWIEDESGARSVRQSAYRILVATDRGALAAERGDLWDSGRVESNATYGVEYGGAPLPSGAACFWMVRAWDGGGRVTPWSAPASFATGLLDPAAWAADWIGWDEARELAVAAADHPDGLFLPPPRYLRREFTAARAVRRAMLYASALGIYETRLNGERVGDDYFTPGWTDYARRVYYDTYDVTSLVRPGANAIGAVLADGWFSGHVGWGRKRDHYGDTTRFRAQLVLEYEDGTREVVVTDGSWRAAAGPLLEADFLMGEAYDARRAMPGWDAAGFDASAWSAVDVTPAIAAEIGAHPGPRVGEVATFTPIAVTAPAPGVHVLDMGQNFAGVVRLRVRGAAGREIVLRHAEVLNPDGTIYTTNLRGARATDRYICRGDGEETWQPRFTFHGFRFVEVTGLDAPPAPGDFVGVAIGSRTPPAGSFECDDGGVNQLVHNIYWTQRMNYIDIPTDCPQRDERLGWTGDAQVYARTATYLCDVQAFFTKWLVDLADGQRKDGQFPTVAPLKVSGSDGGPAWADAGVICPWTIYEVYGDRRLLARHYEGMKRYVAFCAGRCREDLRPPAEFHCYGDWLNIQDETPKDVLYLAYLARSTQLTARAAAALGRAEDTTHYEDLFARIARSFQDAYVGADGRIAGDTQTAYALALAFGLVEGENRARAEQHLLRKLEERDWHLSTGFVGTKDLMLVLAEIGREDVAYRLLHQDTFPSWGFSIAQGATTIWERWNGWTPEAGFNDPGMNSFAHYAFGAVGEWIFRTVGGIDLLAPGYDEILIRPRPGGRIGRARASHLSVHGPIETSWERDGDGMRLDVAIPPNTTALVHVPCTVTQAVTEGGGPLASVEGVEILGHEDGAAKLRVASGRYSFRVE